MASSGLWLATIRSDHSPSRHDGLHDLARDLDRTFRIECTDRRFPFSNACSQLLSAPLPTLRLRICSQHPLLDTAVSFDTSPNSPNGNETVSLGISEPAMPVRRVPKISCHHIVLVSLPVTFSVITILVGGVIVRVAPSAVIGIRAGATTGSKRARFR
jgi:hypothetical protein